VPLRQLRRVRWAVRAALALGVAASVAANVLHAERNLIAQTIAAWPPLALLLNVELISRVPMHRRHLAGIRLVATAAIAGIAAWVSYWHMVAVAARYGEVGSVPFLLPISVDGLVIVASVSLVELAGRIRMVEDAMSAPVAPAASATPATAPASATPASAPASATPASPAPAAAAHNGSPGASPVPAARPGVSPAPVSPLGAGVAAALTATSGVRRPAGPGTAPAEPSTADQRRLARAAAAESRSPRTTGKVSVPTSRAGTSGHAAASGRAAASSRATASGRTTAPGQRGPSNGAGRAAVSRTAPGGASAPRARRPVAETLRLIEEITAERPHTTDDELADELGITLKRLRTVRSAA
jgi:hypothetical protein